MNLRALTPTEMPAARELLASSGLPTDDLDDPSISLIGAFANASLVGVIGLQTCGNVGLLRSLAVLPERRGDGIAHALCEYVFELAAARSFPTLWLLTTTANDYFTKHDFEAVPRDQTPDAIRATAQFSSLCPSSAHVMRRS